MFGPKDMCFPKLFGSIKKVGQDLLGPTKIVVQKNNWSKKTVGQTKMLGQNDFLSKKDVGPKKCLVFWTKLFKYKNKSRLF